MFNQVLLFQSDEILLEPPLSEGGLPSDLPLGNDICAFLKARLESNEVAWSIGDPVREDFGADRSGHFDGRRTMVRNDEGMEEAGRSLARASG